MGAPPQNMRREIWPWHALNSCALKIRGPEEARSRNTQANVGLLPTGYWGAHIWAPF